MNPIRRVKYLGRDLLIFQELIEALRPSGFIVEWCHHSAARLAQPGLDEDWYQVLVIDADVETPEGQELVTQVRESFAGVPLVVVCEARQPWLTVHGLAWLQGVNALFFKPLTDFTEMCDVVRRAFTRLDRWRDVFERLPEQPTNDSGPEEALPRFFGDTRPKLANPPARV